MNEPTVVITLNLTLDLGQIAHRRALSAFIDALETPSEAPEPAPEPPIGPRKGPFFCDECSPRAEFETAQARGSHRRWNHPKSTARNLVGTLRPRDLDGELEQKRLERAAAADARLSAPVVEHATATELPPPVQGPPLPPGFPSPPLDGPPTRVPFDPDQVRQAAAEAL